MFLLRCEFHLKTNKILALPFHLNRLFPSCIALVKDIVGLETKRTSFSFLGFGHTNSYFLAVNVLLAPDFFQLVSIALKKLHSGTFYYDYRFFSTLFSTFIDKNPTGFFFSVIFWHSELSDFQPLDQTLMYELTLFGYVI